MDFNLILERFPDGYEAFLWGRFVVYRPSNEAVDEVVMSCILNRELINLPGQNMSFYDFSKVLPSLNGTVSLPILGAGCYRLETNGMLVFQTPMRAKHSIGKEDPILCYHNVPNSVLIGFADKIQAIDDRITEVSAEMGLLKEEAVSLWPAGYATSENPPLTKKYAPQLVKLA